MNPLALCIFGDQIMIEWHLTLKAQYTVNAPEMH